MELSFQIFKNQFNRFFHVFEKFALIFSLGYCGRKLDTLSDKIAILPFPHMNAKLHFRHFNHPYGAVVHLMDRL